VAVSYLKEEEEEKKKKKKKKKMMMMTAAKSDPRQTVFVFTFTRVHKRRSSYGAG
jgi:hypothetical protein